MKELIKKLRDLTSAGFMDCKKALDEANGNFDAAVEVLKKNGIVKAAKKLNNETAQGSVSINQNERGIVVMNFRSETDFAVNSDAFCKFVDSEAKAFLDNNVDKIEDLIINGVSFADRLSFFASTLGENVILNKFVFFKNESDKKAAYYLHNKVNSNFSNIAKMGVVLFANQDADEDILKKIAVHIAACDPVVLNASDLNDAICEQYEDADKLVLMDQPYFYDDSVTVKQFVEKQKIKILSFQVFFS